MYIYIYIYVYDEFCIYLCPIAILYHCPAIRAQASGRSQLQLISTVDPLLQNLL